MRCRPRHGFRRAKGSHGKCKHLFMLVCLWQTSYADRSLQHRKNLFREEITMDMNSNLDDIPDVLTVNEASEILGVCSKTCCKLIKENQLYGVKVGRSYRIAKIELLKFLKIIPTDEDQSG